LNSIGEKKFRCHSVDTNGSPKTALKAFDGMTDVSKALRAEVRRDFVKFVEPEVGVSRKSQDAPQIGLIRYWKVGRTTALKPVLIPNG